MNVSLHRISKTPDSLQSSLDFYHTRYEFLLRSGFYRHPDANQQGMKLVEAEPELTKIILKSDSEFLEKCSPNITLEELNAFKSILYIDQEEKSKDLTDTDMLTDVEFIRKEDDRFSGTYKGKKRSLKK
ncbi:uncharacterized protein LOC111704707 [Eurytemora carolleeae]|uniref:uncharacterized protein LOC111704707 n=1 Tax=Eurytemora carolleeae TaxID=1294199 RepID=UPI000C75D90B|nr:uncharacterized protein LOC111704707 [Eurytemora carolleeae]|eukprot:XP_023332795.1 uncharacterized protein LOC111704707 [Eurytemora affinis]